MKKIAIVIVAIMLCTVCLTACRKDEQKTYPAEYKKTDGTKAVVIVPGILASGMYDAETKEPVWDPLTTDDVDMLEFLGVYLEEGEEFNPLALPSVSKIIENEFLEVLSMASALFSMKEGNLLDRIGCDEEGESKYDVVGVDWFDEEFDGHIRYGALNSCRQLVEGLQQLVGDEYEVVMYNYNWTQDNRKAVEGLTKLMNDHNYTESILIAHSMGGLVSTGYLAASVDNRARIDKFISIGTPFYGSFMATEIYEDPYVWKGMIDGALNSYADTLKSLHLYDMLNDNLSKMYDELIIPTLFNMTSIYQLLPTADLVSLAKNEGKDCFVSDGTVISAEGLYPWYCTRNWSTTHPLCGAEEVASYPTRTAMKTLPSYRDSLYAETNSGKVFGADLVDTYYIAGRGVGTVNGMVIDGDDKSSVTTLDGDGTVPLLSAARGKAEDNDHVYYVEGVAHIPLGCWWQGELVEILTKILTGDRE